MTFLNRVEEIKLAPSRAEGGTHGHSSLHNIFLELQISETFDSVDLAFVQTRPGPRVQQPQKESVWTEDSYSLLLFLKPQQYQTVEPWADLAFVQTQPWFPCAKQTTEDVILFKIL